MNSTQPSEAMARLRTGMIVRLLTEYKLAYPWPTIPVGTLGRVLAVPPGFLTVRFNDYPPVSARAEDLEPPGRLVQLRYRAREVRLSPTVVAAGLAWIGLVPGLVGVVVAHLFHAWFGW